jgi:quercetin dioxygenase-like cupin family protein
MKPEVHSPNDVYLHLGTGPEVGLEPVTDTFWTDIDDRSDLMSGRLVTGLSTAGDWSVWEMHPKGDEIIIVTAGSCRFHLDDGVEVTTSVVTAPEYIVVPKGTWHTMDEIDAGHAVVITWGDGTTHRTRAAT